MLETTHLLSSIQESKGQCWICWEKKETCQNPLIRACRGCKDPDLQWVHQQCIDLYVNNQLSCQLKHFSNVQPPHCTRCMDEYHVHDVPFGSIRVLLNEKFLLFACLVMSISTMTIFYSCIGILVKIGRLNANNESYLYFIQALACFILIFSLVLSAFVGFHVYMYCQKCRFRTIRHVRETV